MIYKCPKSKLDYLFNLIDTPGHVDFSYQVSRSIRACEGAVLVVDATKGIQAQTISNFYHAFDAGLQIIPVVNKIELPAADIEETENQLLEQLDFEKESILRISAKEGIGLSELFQAIIDRIKPPPFKSNTSEDVLKCFLFDARFVQNRGVACYLKVMSGIFNIEQVRQLFSFHNKKRYEVYEVGIVKPDLVPTGHLKTG